MDYARVFSTDPGRCFRWIYTPSTTQPMRCPEPVTCRGIRVTPKGKHYEVDACAEHGEQLRGKDRYEDRLTE